MHKKIKASASMTEKPLHKAMQNLMKQTNQQAETKPTLFPYSMQPNVVMFEQCFEIRLWKMFISFNMLSLYSYVNHI